MNPEERGSGQVGGFSETDYKVCDLCGALNRVSNAECFVCGWAGEFHRDPETVRQALREFRDYYGGISQTLLAEELLPDQQPRSGLLSDIWRRVKMFLSGHD
jgi:hypothetical protein